MSPLLQKDVLELHKIMKKNLNLITCCKCQIPKDIIKLIMWYGKLEYVCSHCETPNRSKRPLLERNRIINDTIN